MKGSKRWLSLLLVFAMLMSVVSGLSLTAFAEDGNTLTISAQKNAAVDVSKAQTVDVEVSASNNTGFMQGDFEVEFDTTALELTSVTLKTEALKAGSHNLAKGVVAFETDGNAVYSENGVFLVLTFKVLDAAQDQTYPITLKERNGFSTLNGLIPVDVATNYETGAVTITGVTPAAPCVSVKSGAKTTAKLTTGAQDTTYLSDIFADEKGHTMTYSYKEANGKDLTTQTKIATDAKGAYFNLSVREAGTYVVVLTAACSDGKTAEHTITYTVEEAPAGTDDQYGYDETPADSVTVYVTVSSDGVPLVGNDTKETVLSHLAVTVPYFDLEEAGLADFYRYHTNGGKGSYVDNVIVKRPTALHLYLYMLGVYYMGKDPAALHDWIGEVYDAAGGHGVFNMNGNTPYDDVQKVLYITGSPTSMYMANFWGHDENLMYYRNHVYPLMGPGWGSTADYILLSDGDTIDVAMFGNWSFWQYGAFAAFDQDDYTVQPGNTLRFSTVKYDTRSVAEGGGETFQPITGLTVKVYDENWKELTTVEPTAADSNDYSYTFSKAGTYYLMALDPNAGQTGAESEACYAPATAKVIVGGGSKPFDPDDYYKSFDFSKITLDAAGTDYVYNIAESSMYVSHFSNPGEKKIYTLTVPEGTQTVYVTYPADFDQTILEYCALFDDDGNVSWDYYAGSDYDYSVTQNDDGTTTIALPAAFLLEKGLNIAAENDDNYDYFNCFKFVVGDNTKPGDSVAVTGVKLDKETLTVARRATQKLTATVSPENATNTKVTWSTSNSKVATVDKDGVVMGVAAGEATITATTRDGGFTAECKVTVTDENKPAVNEDDGYYEITTAAQLKWFADEANDGNPALNARLMNDIDLSSVCSAENGSWTPIGNYLENQKYTGTFDGQNHKVENLYLNETLTSVTNVNSYYRALFGMCQSATIKNLTVTGNVTSNSRFVAGIVGRAWTSSSDAAPAVIENCHNEVAVTSTCTNQPAATGGIAADGSNNTVIRNCSNSGKIVGSGGKTGGITGGLSGDAVIDGCYNSGYVYNKGYNSQQLGTGGIAGNISAATIRNCYNTGKVEYYYRTQAHKQGVGGIAGYLEKGSAAISSSYNYGELVMDEVTATAGTRGGVLGGIGGDATYTLTNCFFVEDENGRFGDQNTYGAKAVAAERFGTAELVSSLGSRWQVSCPYAVLDWQTATAHTEPDSVTGKCTNCGAQLTGGNHAPTLKEGIDEAATATTDTRTAYTLDLSTIFTDADEGDTLTYRVSVDNGADEAVADGKFSKQYEGVGTHTLVFTANDGKSDSLVSYRVTLTVTWPTPAQDENGAYLIYAVDEMLWFRDAVNGGSTEISAKLMADLDLTALGNWTPIAASSSTKFAGTFDGNQHTLKLHYDMKTSGKPNFGFFKYVDKAGTVKDLKLDYDKLSTISSQHLGGVVDINAGTISGCTVTVQEFYTNQNYGGGICASNSGTIENCTVTATSMSLGGYGGGIVGENTGKILNCTMNGEIVKAGKNSGGIVGYHNGSSAEVSGCVNNANITATYTSNECDAGGIVGYARSLSKITNCVNKGKISSTKGYIGGVVGYLAGSVTNCGNEGAVTGSASYIGGVAGYVSGSSVIKGCYNKAAVNSTYASGSSAYVGGIAGNAYSNVTIENCYNTGDVSVVKGKYAAGLLGYGSNNTSTKLTNCYNTGKVTNDASMASYTKPFYGNASLATNCYDLNEEQPGVTKVTAEQLRYLAETLGEAFEESCGEFPLLKWQDAAKAHTEPDASGKCTVCGKQLLDPNHAPKRKEGVEATATATTDTKTAYTLDLNTIFTDEDNDALTYYVSVDGGEKTAVSGSTYSVTYDAVGTHTLVFTANDGKLDSLDTYTVTLTVEMAAPAQDEAGSYLIYTLDELTWFVNKVNSGDKTASAKLMADIDASSIASWEPIKSFGGAFDGNGKVLSGIKISYTSSKARTDMGVFSEITAGGTVKNLTVRYTSAVRTYSSRLGGIAANNAGTISGCTVQSAAVFGGTKDSIVGGICGKNTGTIENCTVAMLNKLQGTDSIGGICGYSEGTIKDCTVSGEISVNGLKTGGIVGELAGDGSTVTGCTNKAKVSNSNNNTANCVGGIAGTVTKNSTITKCANTGDITSGGGKMGGIAGNMQKGSVSECYNTGAITSTYPSDSTLWVAGLIGYGYSNVVTTDSYNTGAVTVETGKYVAGLVGGARYSSTTITNCYNAGTVTNTKGTDASPAFGGTLIKATNCYALNGAQTGVTQLTEAELKQAADKLGDRFDDSCNEFPPLKWQNAAKAHTVVESGATEATCTEPAHTASKVCSVCGKVVEAGQPVGNPLGHDYQANYTWTETADGYSCTAEAVCSHDASHKITENATVTSTSKDATCETAGEVVYTATFTNNEVFTTQTKTITGTVLGHDYGTPSYTWTETADGYSCTAEAVCSRDASHKLTETVNATGKTTAATCETAGQTVYTATFTNEKFEAQTKTVTLNALGHDYGTPSYTWTETADGYSCTAEAVCSHDASHKLTETVNATGKTTAATCETAGETVYTATFANAKFEAQTKTVTLNALGHDYGTPSYTWTETGDGYSCTAETVCSHDASHKITETAAVTSQTTEATCEAAGKTVYTATFTNEAFTTQTKTITLNALGHEYGSVVYAWSSDHKSCTATRSCTRTGCTHKQTANAAVTETITKKPTYSETGSADYTAVFTEDWAATQILTGVTLPKLTQPVTPVTPAKPTKPETGKTDTVKLPFADVTRDDWFFAAVKGVYEKGLMSGTSATKFSPNDNTTRGMVVTILARLDGVKTAGSNPWYAAGRTWAMANGISDGTNMEGNVTREQLAAILYRYAVMKGYDVRVSASLSRYSDADQVSGWAVTAMRWAVGAGLINGRSANTLVPQGTATRAEVAAILLRFVSLYEK